MKNYIISLLSVIIGTSFLSIAIVNEKFKNNIRVIVTLIILITVFRGLPSLDMDAFSMSTYQYTADNMLESSELSVEKVINDSIEKQIRNYFNIDEIIVESDVFINNDFFEIVSVNVSVSAEVELFDIWEFLRNNLNLSGDIYVKIKKNEGIK